MPKHHTIISGTGRAGTTFLVQLLTALGLETGFRDVDETVSLSSHAGMEWDLRTANAPYIVKSPWLCDYLDEVLENPELIVDHAVIPVRDLYAAAESRRYVSRKNHRTVDGDVPGGLWHTEKPSQQEAILTQQLYNLVHALAKHDIPTTLLYFPRLTEDPTYLYRKLNCLCGNIPFSTFLKAFERVAQPALVHRFSE